MEIAMDTDRLAGKAKETFGKAEAGICDAVGDRETQASGRIRQTDGSAQDVYGAAKEHLSDAAGSAAGAPNAARDAAKPIIETIESQAKANPVVSLLIAAAVGYLLSMLTSRLS